MSCYSYLFLQNQQLGEKLIICTHIYLDLKKTVICEMNYLAQTVRLIWHVLTQREVVLFVGKDIGKDTWMYAKHSRMHGLLFFATWCTWNIAHNLRGHRLTPLDSLYYAGYSTAELLHYWYVIRFGDILIFPCKQN